MVLTHNAENRHLLLPPCLPDTNGFQQPLLLWVEHFSFQRAPQRSHGDIRPRRQVAAACASCRCSQSLCSTSCERRTGWSHGPHASSWHTSNTPWPHWCHPCCLADSLRLRNCCGLKARRAGGPSLLSCSHADRGRCFLKEPVSAFLNPLPQCLGLRPTSSPGEGPCEGCESSHRFHTLAESLANQYQEPAAPDLPSRPSLSHLLELPLLPADQLINLAGEGVTPACVL